MASIKVNRRHKLSRIGSLILLVFFLGTAYFSIRNGKPGEWQTKCSDFWQKGQWHEIRALGENLYRLNQATPEVLYFAMLASEEIGRRGDAEIFAGRLLQQKFINRTMEREIANIYAGNTLMDKIRLHRTDLILLLLLCLFVVQIISIARRVPVSLPLAFLSLTGIVFCIV